MNKPGQMNPKFHSKHEHKAARLLHILALLRDRPMSSAELAAETGADQRTMQRDIKTLAAPPLGFKLTRDTDCRWHLYD
jgi:predicted DNA-binding transcriptional regulator YafY